ncbi:MAG: hypothetical protein RLZZ584_773 [Pseudomonadota bacterium]|jgi:hypothetical protein
MATLDTSSSFAPLAVAVPSLLEHAAAGATPQPDGGDDQPGWQDSDLLTLVDLKWLMAGYGQWLDLPRLRRDDGYARAALHQAQGLPSELIRRVAQRVIHRLDTTPH